MTIKRDDLSRLLHLHLAFKRSDASAFTAALFEEMSLALERGETIKLGAFGRFSLRTKATRPGRNPKTGEMIPVSARRVVTFQASPMLKAYISTRRESNNRAPAMSLHTETKDEAIVETASSGRRFGRKT